MEKTQKEIVFSILEGLNSYNISDDSVFDEDYIRYQVDIARISLIKEELQAGKLGDEYFQPMCCIEVECEAEGCDVPFIGFVRSGDVTYFAEIPGLIPFMGYQNIKYLGEAGWNNNFYRVPFSSFVRNTVGQWTQAKTIYTVINGKVLFRNLPTKGLKYICILALLETPSSACDYEEDKGYPVSDPLKLEIIVVKNVLSRLGINYSEKNNANPDINQQQKK